MGTKRKTRAQLERDLVEVRAGSVSNLGFAHRGISKLSTDHCMGSGVLMEISTIGGDRATSILIRDGLSLETIGAIKADIVRSHRLACEFGIKE